MYTNDGKDQYYFDMKNNPEHYQLLTSDLTAEEYAVFEDREKLRADALFYSRKVMQELVAKKFDKDEQKRIADLAKRHA